MSTRPKTSRTKTAVIAGCLIAATANAAPLDRWNLPITTKKLDNGLTVVVSEDHSSPTVGISVIYRVGIRTEPRDRTGFAHLFEHLMFEGTPKAPHGVFDRVTNDGGGDNNGSTHPDFTSYIDRAPVSALEPLLWLEADRMKTLAFTQKSLDGQRDVVKEEIRVNVHNQPYGGFAETDLPQLAFQKWENGHDGYGSFDDLDKASVDDVRGFHRDFYGPNNAVLGIAGDVTPEQGFALAQKYFGAIPARPAPPRPDVEEPLNTSEKRLLQGDGLARLPAIAVGWKMPSRGSRDQAAMIVLGELLATGDASRLYQSLVKGTAPAVQVESFTGSSSPWEYDGPTLYTLLITYKPDVKADTLLSAIDVQIARIQKEGVDPVVLQGLKTRMLADWYDGLEPFVDRAETLAILQAVWGDARVANQVPELIDAVTSADLQRVAGAYLTHPNRSVIDRRPDDMLPPGDPARSELREKAKPKPRKPAPAPKPVGKVSVGDLEPVQEAPASPAPVVKSPATPSNKAPEDKPQTLPPPPAQTGSSGPASAGTAVAKPVPAKTPPPASPASGSQPPGYPPGADPGQAKPDSTRPEPAKAEPTPAAPETASSSRSSAVPTEPQAVAPSSASPAGPVAPESNPEAGKPDATKSAAAKPETAKPVSPKAEVKAPATTNAESSRPDLTKGAAVSPASNSTEARKSDAKKPDSAKSGDSNPDAKTDKVKKSGSKKPDTKKPTPKKPEPASSTSSATDPASGTK